MIRPMVAELHAEIHDSRVTQYINFKHFNSHFCGKFRLKILLYVVFSIPLRNYFFYNKRYVFYAPTMVYPNIKAKNESFFLIIS